MSGGLIIRLRPYEKFLINGAIVENGEKRAQLRVRSSNANILRLRDALHPDDANTPVKRLYFKTQLALTGDTKPEDAIAELIPGLKALHDALSDETCRELIDNARNRARSGEFYHVIRLLKQLIPYESKLLIIADVKALGNETKQAPQ